MNDMIERGAEAMRAKRRELINQPLERVWPDLMRAALGVMREPTDATFGGLYGVEARRQFTDMIDAALWQNELSR